MLDDIVQVIGEYDGPISMIMGGVHGNERPGFEALQAILPNLEIENGTVFFAYGNPRAIEKNVRFTEANLNRMFQGDDKISDTDKKSYEYQRAQVLKSYLEKADVLLDLHASSVPASRDFAICESNAVGVIEYLPTGLVVNGFDDIEPGATDGYMNSIGKVGICLECGYMIDPKATKLAKDSVFAFLKARGHITGSDLDIQKQEYVHMDTKYYAKTDSFRLERQFENFEKISSGTLIGVDGMEEIRALRDCLILFAHNGNKIGDEVFLLGEEKSSLV